MADKLAAASALDTAGASKTTQLVAQPVPLRKRVAYTILTFIWFKLFRKTILACRAAKQLLRRRRRDEDPDLVKSYPVRKSLTIRVFFPPSYTNNPPSSRDAPAAKLPTLLTIHGGGFVLGDPHDNDRWNRAFARRHGFVVVALDYAKAPAGPFPTAVHDIEALVGCVLADAALPVDAGRVALAGWSAGGNLALAAAQLPSVRARVRAAVPLYPVVDVVTGSEAKARGRRYKPALGGFRGRDRDYLLPMMGLFSWAYLAPGQRRDDPLLSPLCAPREALPRNVFVVACELDLLAPEAWRLACKLAGKPVPGLDEVVGREETVGAGRLITDGDERFAWDVTTDDGSRYRWLLVPDTIHGFDQDNIGELVRDPDFLEDARIKTNKVIDMVGQWLLDGPLKADA